MATASATSASPSDTLTAKFVIVGSAGSGKTSLLLRYTMDSFRRDQQATIGVDLHTKSIETRRGGGLLMLLWDTAGMEDFQSVARSYYRESAAALIVFDVTDRSSFDSVSRWLNEVRSNCKNEEISIMLAANKCDFVEQRVVSREEGEAFARSRGLAYVEVSAKTGEGVANAFMSLAQTVVRKVDQGVLNVDDASSGVKRAEKRSNRSLLAATTSTAVGQRTLAGEGGFCCS